MDTRYGLIVSNLAIIIIMMIVITSCTQQKPATLDDARQAVVDAIMRSDAYTQYDVTNFTETQAAVSDGGYAFTYEFKASNNDTPDVEGFKVHAIYNDSKISDITYEQIMSDSACKNYTVDQCPDSCTVCPPCPECSSISCESKSFCESIGFNDSWYGEVAPSECPVPIEDRYNGDTTCENKCGDGVCNDVVCQDAGCPCEENKTNCPEDCGK